MWLLISMAKKSLTPWENFFHFFTLGSSDVSKKQICIVVPSTLETILILLYTLPFLYTTAFPLFFPRF